MLHNKPQQDLKNTVIDPKYINICALGNGTTENTPRDVSPETNSTDNNIYPILSNSSPAYSLAYAKPSGQESPPGQSPRDKRRQYSNPLIKQLHDGVKAGDISEPLTTHKVEQWMAKYDIRKGDGTKYKEGYAANILYNSLIKEKKTKNRNSKWLHRRKNENGIFEYWFAD